LTESFIFKSEHATIINKERKEVIFLPVLGDMIARKDTKSGLGFVLGHGTIENSEKILFLYFYVPFFLIILLSIKVDCSLFISLIYYFEMTFLFLFKHFFIRSHSFLSELLGVKSLSSYLSYIQLFVIVLLFLYGIYSKFKKKNTKSPQTKAIMRIIVIFFLLLPILLRF